MNTENLIRNYLKDKKFLANNFKALWVVLTTIAFHAFALWTYFGMNSWFLFVLTYSLIKLRWFVIYHDCTHLSFWEKKRWCVHFGHILSFLLLTPYTYWRINHLSHHDHSGDRTSTKYDFNDTVFFTVREYVQLPTWKRYLYRFFRDPIIFFTILPFIKFFILHRFHNGSLMTNVGGFFYCYIIYYVGGVHLFALFTLTVMLSTSWGFILFHMQHTYNPTYVNIIPGQYSKYDSSLQGSSCIIMPPILKWFTLGIEYHHIHHMVTQIPCYNLEYVYKNAPSYFWDGIFTFDSFQKIIDSLSKTLWDEEQNRFVGFSEVSQQCKKTD
jgi:omega-6 fatty acid desaturase (delta-12 desaturase)